MVQQQQQASVIDELKAILPRLGVKDKLVGGTLVVRSPITGETLALLHESTFEETTHAIARADEAFHAWRLVPAPKRGELVRLFGEELRAHKEDLARIVTLEAGKVVSEGLGEVQEMIDICDYAVGLSRQLFGLTIATERPLHRMMETWHPLGVTAIVSAFNFPVAVWAWNSALALVCGNTCIWKPSEKTPLTALATQALFQKALAKFPGLPVEVAAGLSQVLIGGAAIGEAVVSDARVPLVSATGSTMMGRAVAPKVAARFARAILELGGNNAAIVCPSADLDLTLRAVAFSAMGTAGQRCTTLRRLFVHESVYDALMPKLLRAYESVSVGDPRADGVLIGPLVDEHAFTAMTHALDEVSGSGKVHGGARVHVGAGGVYVRPALVEMKTQEGPMLRETFAPILYVVKYKDLKEVITQHNAVAAGLSSSIFTTDLREAELFLSAAGSDCGIANVNIGPSGAEIGGAFGGEKETGGGRESGSDAWKAYMRRQTNTINYSDALPLAQGIKFDL